jgi:threonine/homoserine/homoserine lactone efflux protein
LTFALILVLIPGADFTVVTRNTLVGGRQRGMWCAAGVACSNSVQGVTAAAGLGVLIVRVEPLFEAIKWAGICYLAVLAVQALRSAVRGRYPSTEATAAPAPRRHFAGWRQGFLSNITNPKVLVFYLAVLPQFLGPHAALPVLVIYALSHAVLSLLYLLGLVTVLHGLRELVLRRRVRRSMDAASGLALLGFGARLAAEHA